MSRYVLPGIPVEQGFHLCIILFLLYCGSRVLTFKITYKSPVSLPGSPRPRRIFLPDCVPVGTFKLTLPAKVEMAMVSPKAASHGVIGTSIVMSASSSIR